MTTMPDRPLTEIDGQLGFIARQRAAVRGRLAGVSDEQARRQPLASTTLTLGGILKHLVAVERSWIRTDIERGPEDLRERDDEFTLRADETLQQYLDRWEVEAAHTDEVIRGRIDGAIDGGIELDREVPDPHGRPSNNVRWVLAHLIEEFARHAGHADLIREAIDGTRGGR